jgi:hypothetical protein
MSSTAELAPDFRLCIMNRRDSAFQGAWFLIAASIARSLQGSMDVSQTEIVSLVSQTGDEYLALLLVPCGGSNRIVIGRGVSEIEAHEQLVSEVAKLIANPTSPLIL